MLCYADHIILTAPLAVGLQLLLDNTSIFKKRKNEIINSNVNSIRNDMPEISSEKYLGVILHEDMSTTEGEYRVAK